MHSETGEGQEQDCLRNTIPEWEADRAEQEENPHAPSTVVYCRVMAVTQVMAVFLGANQSLGR